MIQTEEDNGLNGGVSMYRDMKKSRKIIFTTLLFLVTSCAVSKKQKHTHLH